MEKDVFWWLFDIFNIFSHQFIYSCNKYRKKGWPVISGICICYMPAIRIARLQCPGHDALTMLYTLHGEVMHISGLVFIRACESPNQCLVITCCDCPNSPRQSCWALPYFRYCILSHITTPLVLSNVNNGHSHMSVA